MRLRWFTPAWALLSLIDRPDQRKRSTEQVQWSAIDRRHVGKTSSRETDTGSIQWNHGCLPFNHSDMRAQWPHIKKMPTRASRKPQRLVHAWWQSPPSDVVVSRHNGRRPKSLRAGESDLLGNSSNRLMINIIINYITPFNIARRA